MSCNEWASAIDAMMDDELEAVAMKRLEAHLAVCVGCREMVVDLRSLRQATEALPLAIEPPRDFWPSVASRLSARPVPVVRRFRPWHLEPLWAVAAAALIIFGVWLSQERLNPSVDTVAQRDSTNVVLPVTNDRLVAGPAIAATRDAATTLRAQVEARWGSLTPATRTVLERNLDVIDQAVLEIETALASEPEDQGLQSLLLASYRQQISLLERLVELG